MSRTRRTFPGARLGVNLVETLFALVLVGILLAMGGPRLSEIKVRGSVRSARDQVQGYLLTARAAAMRRGQPATFHMNTDTQAMWVLGSSNSDTIARLRPMQTEFSVTLSGVDSVRFNSRGFATNLTTNRVIRVTRDSYSDSLCVSRLGTITTQCGF